MYKYFMVKYDDAIMIYRLDLTFNRFSYYSFAIKSWFFSFYTMEDIEETDYTIIKESELVNTINRINVERELIR